MAEGQKVTAAKVGVDASGAFTYDFS
jgi:hypothetical protein